MFASDTCFTHNKHLFDSIRTCATLVLCIESKTTTAEQRQISFFLLHEENEEFEGKKIRRVSWYDLQEMPMWLTRLKKSIPSNVQQPFSVQIKINTIRNRTREVDKSQRYNNILSMPCCFLNDRLANRTKHQLVQQNNKKINRE